jgi:hypothetical protein
MERTGARSLQLSWNHLGLVESPLTTHSKTLLTCPIAAAHDRLIGVREATQIFYGVSEIALTGLAVWYAWNWPRQKATQLGAYSGVPCGRFKISRAEAA